MPLFGDNMSVAVWVGLIALAGLELVVYPALYLVWKGRRLAAGAPEGAA